MMASLAGDVECAKVLLDKGAETDQQSEASPYNCFAVIELSKNEITGDNVHCIRIAKYLNNEMLLKGFVLWFCSLCTVLNTVS